jgi:hypothetical protein
VAPAQQIIFDHWHLTCDSPLRRATFVPENASEDADMMTMLLRAVNGLFCQHEWITRAQPQRLYLECVNCLAISPGIDTVSRRTDTRRDAVSLTLGASAQVGKSRLSSSQHAA